MDQLLGRDQPVVPDKCLPCCLDSLLAVFCQGEVRHSRVPAVQRPLGFAVANDEAAGRHVGNC